MTSQQLPLDVYNHLISFRPTHPVAKLMNDFKRKFSYCIVCYEQPRCGKLECCSSTCHRQYSDANYYDYGFPGDQFKQFMELDEE